LDGTLVVSCQADAGSPLDAPEHIGALAASVVEGGASAVRIEGVTNITTVSGRVAVPVIGLVKTQHAGTDVYITATVEDVQAIAGAGAEIIAFDATRRPRPVNVPTLIEAVKRRGCLAMADISTAEEAELAMAAGADVVSTTMAGYTDYTRGQTGPDFSLMDALGRAGIPFVAEGRIWTPEDALRCLQLGARFIVAGSVITRPTLITRHFIEQIASGAAQVHRKASS
jgi:N-acylglucosamine-6-phosphate 2-epimerase